MTALGSQLNRPTQYFIVEGKDGECRTICHAGRRPPGRNAEAVERAEEEEEFVEATLASAEFEVAEGDGEAARKRDRRDLSLVVINVLTTLSASGQ